MRIIDKKLPNIQVNIKSSADENLIFFENFSKKRKKRNFPFACCENSITRAASARLSANERREDKTFEQLKPDDSQQGETIPEGGLLE